MFAYNESGDASCHSLTPDLLWNPLRISTPTAQSSLWRYRRCLGGNFQTTAMPMSMYGTMLRPNFYFGRPTFQPALFHSLLPRARSTLICYQRPNPQPDCLFSQRMLSSTPSFSVGAGDAPLVVDPQVLTLKSMNQTSDNFHAADKPNDASLLGRESEATEAGSALKITSRLSFEREEKDVDNAQEDSENATEAAEAEIDLKKKNMQILLEKFLHKIVAIYDKLNYRNCYSPKQFKVSIYNLLSESRHLFYKLESSALFDILKENDDWDSTNRVADIFHHYYFSMADVLAVYLLQLILACSEHGFVSIDSSSSDPMSLSTFYRGEFRIGRVLPGVYQMHVTSYHYTTCTQMLQTSETCPLQQHDCERKPCTWINGCHSNEECILHWSYCKDCDPFHLPKLHQNPVEDDELFLENTDLIQYVTSESPGSQEECGDASQLLKMFCWRVRFVQNPDLEEENYYLCCKAIKPYFQEPEYIFQSDSFKYFFGKLVSPKLNFTNPTLEEIVLDCRPSGKFEIIHSFGHQLPLYSVAVGVLVDYLRHKRFKRTVF